MAKPKRWSPGYRAPYRPAPGTRRPPRRRDEVDSALMWAWLVGSVAFAFFVVLVVLDLPLCTRNVCEGPRAMLGSALVVVLVLLVGIGGPLAWWRVRRVGGRP